MTERDLTQKILDEAKSLFSDAVENQDYHLDQIISLSQAMKILIK